MIRLIVTVLLLLGAHFSLSAFAPAPAGQGWVLWPWAAGMRPWVGALGGLPLSSGSGFTPLAAGLSGLGFLLAAVTLFRGMVPPQWWLPLVVVSALGSVLLHVLYFGPWAILPIVVDAMILWGAFSQHWSVLDLRGF